MISSLKGTIIQKNKDSIVLDVSGVGYLVRIPETELLSLSIKEEVRLFTYLAVKEDALDLYGSKMQGTIDWFKLLLSVKGIGPKSALQFLSKAEPKDIANAIHHDDPMLLVDLGIGKKSAERMVLELKNKADALSQDLGMAQTHAHASADAESLQALISLGYSRAQAREALQQSEGEGVSEKIKNALKVLGSAK